MNRVGRRLLVSVSMEYYFQPIHQRKFWIKVRLTKIFTAILFWVEEFVEWWNAGCRSCSSGQHWLVNPPMNRSAKQSTSTRWILTWIMVEWDNRQRCIDVPKLCVRLSCTEANCTRAWVGTGILLREGTYTWQCRAGNGNASGLYIAVAVMQHRFLHSCHSVLWLTRMASGRECQRMRKTNSSCERGQLGEGEREKARNCDTYGLLLTPQPDSHIYIWVSNISKLWFTEFAKVFVISVVVKPVIVKKEVGAEAAGSVKVVYGQ